MFPALIWCELLKKNQLKGEAAHIGQDGDDCIRNKTEHRRSWPGYGVLATLIGSRPTTTHPEDRSKACISPQASIRSRTYEGTESGSLQVVMIGINMAPLKYVVDVS